MQLATQNASKIYPQNAMLTHLCYLTHKQRNSGARLPSIEKEDATRSFTERNLVTEKPTANTVSETRSRLLCCLQGQIKYLVFNRLIVYFSLH